MPKYIIKGFSEGREIYYTGKAGPQHSESSWVSEDANEAFQYDSYSEANRIAEIGNTSRVLHGIYFLAKEL